MIRRSRSIRRRRRPSSTTSFISATTGGGGGRSRPSCCRASSRFAISWARSGSSVCGGTSLQPRGRKPGPQAAFRSDAERFRRLRIRTEPSVMYTDVIRTMSTARINIFTQRPVLHHLKHLTLKYFEIFYADTIPLLMLDEDRGPRCLRAARQGADAARPGRRKAASTPCGGPTTIGTSCKVFAATWPSTIPTTGGSRNWSPRCRIDRVEGA